MAYRDIVIRSASVFWLLTKLLSINGWTNYDRLLPTVPVFDFLDAPQSIHLALFTMSSLGLVFTAFRMYTPVVLIIMVSEILSCSLDVLRWQPYQYMFLFIFFIFIIEKRERQFLTLLLIIFSSTYIYSGLQKLNGGFLYAVWENLILKRFLHVEPTAALHYAGLLLPAIEIISGIALLLSIKRKWAVIVLLFTHVFILIMLLSLNYNIVVIPWNIFMIFVLLKIFYNAPAAEYSGLLNLQGAIVLVFWAILPALSFISLWDKYLSSSLYSGNLKNMYICIDYKGNSELGPLFVSDSRDICGGDNLISLHKWALKETNMTIYPEEWYFRKFQVKFREKYPDVPASVVIAKYPFKEYRQFP